MMRHQHTFQRLLATTLLIIAVGPMIACSGSNGAGGIAAAFTASGTAAAANHVRLRSGSAVGDMITVEVVISGPTLDDDLYSFAFDLLLSDPAVSSYVQGSAVFGPALTLDTGQGQAVAVSQIGDRVVVGVSKTGGGPDSGNAVGAAEEIILSLSFQVMQAGATSVAIVGSPANPQNPTAEPTALDSAGNVIDSVEFDAVTATISGT